MSAAKTLLRAALVALAVTVPIVPASPSFAIDAHRQLAAKAVSPPPAGAVALCRTYAWACARAVAGAAFPTDTADILRRVNEQANRGIRSISDVQQYAVAEKWSLPTERGGDCEDFALYKKRALIEAGLPPERLLIASVLDRKLQPHAVLIVRVGGRDLVLDNLTSRIVSWDKTGYTFLRMQDPRRPDRWVALLTGGVLS